MKRIIIIIMFLFMAGCSAPYIRFSDSVIIPKVESSAAWSRAQAYLISSGYSFMNYYRDIQHPTGRILYFQTPYIGDYVLEPSQGIALTREDIGNATRITCYYYDQDDRGLAQETYDEIQKFKNKKNWGYYTNKLLDNKAINELNELDLSLYEHKMKFIINGKNYYIDSLLKYVRTGK